MEKFLGIGIIVVFVALTIGYIKYSDGRAVVENEDFNIVCLDGVEYWYRKSGYNAVLAAKYNAETGQVETC